jgi:YidC/Oxa1 family membrane protein insertase
VGSALSSYFQVFAAALAGFYALIPSLGVAIILLTVAVRLLLLPLSIKQTKSMREMQRIQPEVKKLQAKHKGDRQKMNEELMALYKEHGVNPFGGCAPLLLQFPVLIALFYVVREPLRYMGYLAGEATSRGLVPFRINENAAGLAAQLQDSSLARALLDTPLKVHQFLGIRLDCAASGALSGAEATASVDVPCGQGVLDAAPYLVLVLLMGATTYYQQKQMQANQSQTNPQAQQMQMFMKIMPVMLMVFSFSFPSGVVLYWLTTNLWTIGQQRLVLQGIREAPVPHKGAGPGNGRADGAGAKPGATRAARASTPAPGKTSPAKGSKASRASKTSNGAQRPSVKSPTANRKKRKK